MNDVQMHGVFDGSEAQQTALPSVDSQEFPAALNDFEVLIRFDAELAHVVAVHVFAKVVNLVAF